MKKHYFLLSAQVVYKKDGLERQRGFNVLIVSDTRTVSRPQLGRAQQQVQVRFFKEFDTEMKSEVVDVFTQGISYLGEMDEKEFHSEFYQEPSEPAQEASVEQPAETEAGEHQEVLDAIDEANTGESKDG